MPTVRNSKPYIKVAAGLVTFGASLLMLERYGAAQLHSNTMHLAGWLLTTILLIPIGLILAGGVTFVVGRMRGL